MSDDYFQMFTEPLEYISALKEGVGEHPLVVGTSCLSKGESRGERVDVSG